MPPHTSAETGVSFRGEARSEDAGAPDTAVLVTDEAVITRPLPDTESDSPPDFPVPLADSDALSCDGMLCRSVTLETDTETYRIPTSGLDEGAFRSAILAQTELENSCTRLGLGQYGICLCGSGTYAGCLLTIVGVGLILSIVGAAMGAAVAAAGLGILAVVFLVRTVAKWRGSNVWERGGPESPA